MLKMTFHVAWKGHLTNGDLPKLSIKIVKKIGNQPKKIEVEEGDVQLSFIPYGRQGKVERTCTKYLPSKRKT